jgi:hypothetical protein
MKYESGASRVWLLIGIVILGIIIVFTTNFMKIEVKKETKENVKTQMLQVQAKAKIVFETYHVDKENGLKGEKLQEGEDIEKFQIPNSDLEKYYKWNQDVLNEVGLGNIVLKDNAFFLINYETEEVIYSKGIEIEKGEFYYKLSDIKKLDEKNNGKEQSINDTETDKQETEMN